MYPVTQKFNQEMVADKRTIMAKVAIDYTSPALDQSVSIEVSEQANVSFPKQTADSIDNPSHKWASLDGSWVLDGSYALASSDPSKFQLGWWGEQLYIDEYNLPTLTVTFAPRPISQLRVVGDSLRGEYPVAFNIYVYSDVGSLLTYRNIANNLGVVWQEDLAVPISNVGKMVLEIEEWSHEGHQIKILEFYTSIQETYLKEDITSLNLLEEREVSVIGLPVGVVTSNEIRLQLNNEDERFTDGNESSPLNNLLKPNRRIRAWIGSARVVTHTWFNYVDDNWGDLTNQTWQSVYQEPEEELVPLGMFWSGDWSVPEDGMTASVVGRDKMDSLRLGEFISNAILEDKTLYDLAGLVFADAGLEPEEFYIDEELQEYTIPYLPQLKLPHREMLRLIAEACLGQAYCDREGIIRVEGSTSAFEKREVEVSEQANVSYHDQVLLGVEDMAHKWASLDGSWELNGTYSLAPSQEEWYCMVGWWGEQLSDNQGSFNSPYPIMTVFSQPRAISSIRIVGDVAREEYPVDFNIEILDSSNQQLALYEIFDNEEITLDVDILENPTTATKVVLTVKKWSHPGRQVKIIRFDEQQLSVAIDDHDYFRKDNPIKYEDVANYIEIETSPIDEFGQALPGAKVIAMDEGNITENGKLKFAMPKNPLIQTENHAELLANRLLDLYKDAKRTLTLEWRGNPALLLGDVITVGNSEYKISTQELDYTGALRAKLTARRLL